jgi:hypothetical protein
MFFLLHPIIKDPGNRKRKEEKENMPLLQKTVDCYGNVLYGP